MCRVYILVIGLACQLFACGAPTESDVKEPVALADRLAELSDSIRVGDVVVKNLFKSQILAHQHGFDSTMIVEQVYQPHRALWDNCYAMIFGENNAPKFNTKAGMVAWNKTLYPTNEVLFDQRAEEILAINIDSVLTTNLTRFSKLVPHKPAATISILFTPFQGIGFGGCDKDQFCFELNNADYAVAYTLEKGIPHELNHFAYEPLRENDPALGSALFLTVDEGFACYFTWRFFGGKITKYEAVEQMTPEEWGWYEANEKQLFTQLEPYFTDTSGDNPLLRNDQHQLFPDAPKSLYYWLGFRMVEQYVAKHGPDSWKDIYTMDVARVLAESDYANYIQSLP